MPADAMKGFKEVRGNVRAVIGRAGTRKVVGYNDSTKELLLRDEERPDSNPFSISAKDVTKVDMAAVLRASTY